ncbi:MAG: FG-GAP repeat protein, partial [Bacteroidota bacterium]
MRNVNKFILFSIISIFCQTTFAQSETELQKLVAEDRASTDLFGFSVSIDGDYAIVGAFNEDEDASEGNTLVNAGSAYIFERTAEGSWQQAAKLVASDRNSGDFFGSSVSINGNYVIVGAYNEDEDAAGGNTANTAGSAYIFEKAANGTWVETAKLVASDRATSDVFGEAVAIDGDYAVVGARAEDQDADGGNFLDNAGSVYIFQRAGDGTWSEVTKLVASDRAPFDNFGASVAIDGDYVIIGANFEDEDVNGENTATEAGAAYVFERSSDDTWTEVAKLVASDRANDDFFGFPVAISGDKVVVGAHQEDEDAIGENRLSRAGSAYIFERSTEGVWAQSAKLVASDRGVADFFGISVDISGDNIVVGAYESENQDTGENVGAAYVFERSTDGDWT